MSLATVKTIESRFRTLGPYQQDKLVRDLVTTIEDLNTQLSNAQALISDLQTQITTLKTRIDTAGIP